MVMTGAERVRKHYRKRVAAADAERREAYAERVAYLSREKVGTLAHFKKWSSRLRLDNGKRFSSESFQSEFISDVFQGRSENWLVIPEGNAKTTLLALLALYCLEFYLDAAIPMGAAARDQVGLLFGQMEGIIERAKDDGLEDFDGFEIHPGLRRIDYLPNRSYAKVFAADDSTADGIIPYPIALIDELHRHRDLRLYRTWRGKLHKRGCQLITISTAGEPGGEFEDTRERIRQQAAEIKHRGSFTRATSKSLLLHEWAVPENADTDDLKVVKSANPLKSVTLAALQDKHDSPTWTLPHWLRFVCGRPSRGVTAAISEMVWESARVKDDIPKGEPIWVGLDIGWIYDTTAIVPLWKRDAEYVLLGPAIVLTPPRNGQPLDVSLIEDALLMLHARNPIQRIVMDTSFGAVALESWITDNIGCEIISRGQTMPQQVEEYERFMEGLREWLHHTGDPELTQHAMNAIARMNRLGATVFDRPKPTRTSGDEQDLRVIDALDAAAMVHAQAMIEVPRVEAWSFYG